MITLSDPFWSDIKAERDKKEAIKLIRQYYGYDESDMSKEEIERYAKHKWNRTVKDLVYIYFDI